MKPLGVVLIRHGKTKLNSDKASQDKIRGWVNVPLDEEGRKELKEIVAFIRTLDPVHIYSSDLDRAADIARAAAKATGAPLNVSKEFRPWGLGSFQGKPAKDVVPQLQQYIDNPTKPVPGGGESYSQFRDRVLGGLRKAMNEQQRSDGNVVVMTHFRDMKLTESWIANGGDKTPDIDAKIFAANDISTGGMILLYRDRGQWKTKRVNRTKVGVKTTVGTE